MSPNSAGLSSLNQKELLERAKRLERDALAAIFDIFYEPVYRYAYRYLHNQQIAEDIASEVFSLMLETLNTRRGPQKLLKAWLFRTAHTLILKKNHPAGSEFQAPVLPEEVVGQDSESIFQQAEDSLHQQVLLEAVHQLTEKQQEVIYLRFFQGLQLEEVAYALNMTVGTVKSLQHRGLQAMRRYIEKNTQPEEVDL